MVSLKERLSKGWNVVLVVGTLAGLVFAVTAAYALIQFAAGRTDLDKNIVNGLLFSFISLAVLMIVAPTVIKLYEEALGRGDESKETEWLTRLRTLITVSLTIVILVFALTWFFAPDRLQAPILGGTSGGANASAANASIPLHPFVRAVMDVYVVVIAFYFPTAAAQSIVNSLKPGGTQSKLQE